MKLIIAGGRDYHFKRIDWYRLDTIQAATPIEEVVCGGATGADSYGAQWADERGIPLRLFPADWERHGKAAGPLRNRQMAEYADAVSLFPGGRGTESMYREAKAAGLEIYDFRAEVVPIKKVG